MALAKPWMSALGKTRAELGKASPAPFVISFLAELVMAFVLGEFLSWTTHAQFTAMSGMISGFIVWFGFVVPTMTVNHRFGGVRPMLTVIDAGHWLAVLLVQGAILGAIR
jgi:hypothetical protein